MPVIELVAIFVVGVAAGAINAVVGSGSLITFPTLLAFGVAPVVANVSNNIGLVPGNASAVYGYRRELAGQRQLLLRLAPFAAAGGLIGAGLLLALPASAFQLVVPVLIIVACVLVIVQPRLSAWVSGRQERSGGRAAALILPAGTLASAVYGGYFGAAQGVLVIGLLGTFLRESMQRVNAVKNVLVAIVNGTAALVFLCFAPVNWVVVALIAAGSTLGGVLGARIGRRLPPMALRVIIVIIGVVSAVKLIFY